MAKVQKIGKQIYLEKDNRRLLVEIFPNPSSKSKIWLNLWLVGWTLCGLVVMFQLLFYASEFAKEQLVFLLIYLSLWAYLEFKIFYAFLWNRKGKELIKVEGGSFSYTKLMGERGLPFEVNNTALSKFTYEKSTERGILNDINRSAWMVGGEVIEYAAGDKLRRLGMKLSESDAVKLAGILSRYTQK
jgi:hypothetical protein